MKKLVFFVFVLSSLTAFNQATSISPYSRYHLGDLNQNWMANNTALGGSTVSLVDSFQVNVVNPASYSLISRNCPAFDVSLRGRFVELNTATSQYKANFFSLNNIVLGIPIRKRWGAAFGLLPFSSSGYNISTSTENTLLGGTVSTSYSGQGGLSRIFIGTSVLLIDGKENKLSIGGNVSYLFGDIEKTRSLSFPEQTGLYDSKVVNSLFAKDFMADFGIFYRNKINARNQLSVGFSSMMGTDINVERSELAFTTYPGSEVFIDTVSYIEDEKGVITLPSRYTMGITYDLKGVAGSKNYYKLSFTSQLQYQDWTKYNEEFENTNFNDTLRRTSGINFGVQFIPHMIGQGSGKINILKLCNYRLGGYFMKNYLSINDVDINEMGVTAGIGIPLIHSFSYSMLNLSFEYGQRGTTDKNLISEKYYGIHVGISFSPNRQVDRWFLKRKFD